MTTQNAVFFPGALLAETDSEKGDEIDGSRGDSHMEEVDSLTPPDGRGTRIMA